MARLNPGDQAPDFILPDQDGKPVRLKDLKGSKVLLYFYPRAGTSGCTRQAVAVRDAMTELKSRGVRAMGASPDSPASLKKFSDKQSLTFTLLSDADRGIAKAYGAFGEKTMYGKKVEGIIRSVFLIDEQGMIQGAFYKISPEDTVPKALGALR
jgi:peroxiredoxin Q/BCP